MSNTLVLTRLSEAATPPYKSSMFSAGLELCSAETALVLPRTSCLVSTGWAARVPLGTYGRITGHSDLADETSHDLQVVETVVNSERQDALKVLVYNHSEDRTLCVEVGQRIAQLICSKMMSPRVVVAAPST